MVLSKHFSRAHAALCAIVKPICRGECKGIPKSYGDGGGCRWGSDPEAGNF
jgi:hypothetical protein